MQRMFGMLVHPDPSSVVLHFRDVAGIDLRIGQFRQALQPLALWFCILRFSIIRVVLLMVLRGFSPDFFIQCPLRTRGLASRDNADDRVKAMFADGMDHQQGLTDINDGLPTLLAFHYAIFANDDIRITKHPSRFLKPTPCSMMFARFLRASHSKYTGTCFHLASTL